LEPEGSTAGMNDPTCLEQLYDAGGAPNFDALVARSYDHGSPPDEAPTPTAVKFRRVELLRDVMVAHGDAARPIYVNEAGWNDRPRWTSGVSPIQRVEYTIKAHDWARRHWPWCTC
jgi:hypothetical protein